MAGSAREQAALLPPAPGVYRFRDAAGRVLYLGRATSLRSRVASYWGDLGGRAHLGRMMAMVARVEAVACDSVHEAAWLERNLLQARKPPVEPRTERRPGSRGLDPAQRRHAHARRGGRARASKRQTGTSAPTWAAGRSAWRFPACAACSR